METVTITIAPDNTAVVEYHDGKRVVLTSEQWARLQAAKLRSIAQYGHDVANAWYYETLLELKFLSM